MGKGERMMQEEKDRLLALFSERSAWCQDCEARNRRGEPVRYDDGTAAAWDLVGGMCRLFGWERARSMFLHVAHHMAGWRRERFVRDPESLAMTALLNYNDQPGTTYDHIVGGLRSLPVWHRNDEQEDLTSSVSAG